MLRFELYSVMLYAYNAKYVISAEFYMVIANIITYIDTFRLVNS